MVDLVVGGLLAALVVRGWSRGLVRSAVGLATLVVGTVVSFRLSTPLGHVVGAIGGTSPEVSRLIAGMLLFTGVSVAGALLVRVAGAGLGLLPGMPTVDRIGGAALSGGAGLLGATLLFSVAALLPLPGAAAGPLEESRIGEMLTDPTGTPQRMLDVAAGDGVLAMVLRLEELVGAPRLGDPGGEVRRLPPVPADEIAFAPRHTVAMRALVNRERVNGGAAPLATGVHLDRVARRHALRIYRSGRMAHHDAAGLGPGDRLDAAGIPHVAVVELMGLGASPDAVMKAWLGEDDSRATLLAADVRRVGVGVYRGPYGLMAVMVAAG